MSAGAIAALFSRGSHVPPEPPKQPKRPKPPKSGIKGRWQIANGEVVEWHGNDTWHLARPYQAPPFGYTRNRIARQEALDMLRRNGISDPYKENHHDQR